MSGLLLRRMFVDRLVELSFLAQNKMIDKIYEENGIPMSDLGQKIIAEVRKVAADKPGYVYPQINGNCNYVRNGQPSCIVGQALWNVGLINSESTIDDYGDSAIKNVVALEDWPLEVGEVNWLTEVQDKQDNGLEWGDAVSRADRYVSVFDDEDI